MRSGSAPGADRIDLEGMVREVSSAKDLYEGEVAQAKEFVEPLVVGRHDIRWRRAQNGYNLPEDWLLQSSLHLECGKFHSCGAVA